MKRCITIALALLVLSTMLTACSRREVTIEVDPFTHEVGVETISIFIRNGTRHEVTFDGTFYIERLISEITDSEEICLYLYNCVPYEPLEWERLPFSEDGQYFPDGIRTVPADSNFPFAIELMRLAEPLDVGIYRVVKNFTWDNNTRELTAPFEIV